MCPAVGTVDPAWSPPMLPPRTQCYLIYSEVAMRGFQSQVLLVSSVISLLSPVALCAPQDRHTALLSPRPLQNCWDNIGPQVGAWWIPGDLISRGWKVQPARSGSFLHSEGKALHNMLWISLLFLQSTLLFLLYLLCLEKPLIRSW